MNLPLDDLSGILFFDPDDAIYRHHFPGNPVVPGTVIIGGFLSAIEKMGCSKTPIAVERFRFLRFIGPGEYPFSIVYQASCFDCRLWDSDKVVVRGKIRV